MAARLLSCGASATPWTAAHRAPLSVASLLESGLAFDEPGLMGPGTGETAPALTLGLEKAAASAFPIALGTSTVREGSLNPPRNTWRSHPLSPQLIASQLRGEPTKRAIERPSRGALTSGSTSDASISQARTRPEEPPYKLSSYLQPPPSFFSTPREEPCNQKHTCWTFQR